jgi:polysaccharide biosynthesis protein PslG
VQRRRIHIILLLCVLLGWAIGAPKPAPAAPDHLIAPLDAAPFGLNTHLASRYPDLLTMNTPADAVAQTGAGWAREDIHWYRVEPWLDNYDWSYTDAAMRALIQRKINIVGVLGHPPGWATPYGGDDANSFSFYAPNPDRFAAYTYAVVSRYSRYVHHWEVWNEPDNPLFWKPAPDPQAYATLLMRASAAIHQADPSAKVLIGGVNPFSTAFLKQVADAGAWNSFDILAIHPYVDPATPEEGNLVAAADGVRALATQLGTKPLWVTEVGWASGASDHDPSGANTEQTQANLLVRAMLLLWRAGVERSFWYTLKDDPGNPYGLFARGTGYSDYGHPKPSFYAFRTLSRQLAGAEFVGMRDLFTRTGVLDFETFGSWRRGDQPNGTLTRSDTQTYSGHAAARLSYRFPTESNDYVVFRRERAAPIPGAPYALGVWVYGDGSGHTLKVWLRDSEGEVLQFALGTVGPPGWRLLQAPIGGTVPPWNRISKSGNGRLDFPARVDSLVLDDGDDRFVGDGAIMLDDMIAISGPEAYDLQLQKGATSIDVLWSPEGLPAAITSSSTSAQVIERDGAERRVPVRDGKITLDLGPAPLYVYHAR